MQHAMLGNLTSNCTIETGISGYVAQIEAIAGDMHAEAESCSPMAKTGIANTYGFISVKSFFTIPPKKYALANESPRPRVRL